MAITVKDIAIAAGVSKAAVSKVLHNSSGSVRVSAERAEQIRTIAREMGYVPNANARILRSSRTHMIGLYFEELSGIASGPLYTTHLLEGVCRVVFQRKYRVALIAHLDEAETVGALGDGRLDGVIWCRVIRDERTLGAMSSSPIPLVALNTPALEDSERVVTVGCDNAEGMENAVEHLWGLGHRKFLFVSELSESQASDCVDRLDGLRKALLRRGTDLGPDDVVTWSWALNEFSDWWNSKPPHTAVICWSERAGGRILEICRQEGIQVPAELSVTGFDSTQFCDTTMPPLTAVRQPIIEMASLAATNLLNLIEGMAPEEFNHTLACPLDVRGSTGPARV